MPHPTFYCRERWFHFSAPLFMPVCSLACMGSYVVAKSPTHVAAAEPDKQADKYIYR